MHSSKLIEMMKIEQDKTMIVRETKIIGESTNYVKNKTIKYYTHIKRND